MSVDPNHQRVEIAACEGPLERTDDLSVVVVKVSRRCASASSVARSFGVSALRWRIEKYSSIWFSHEAWIGRWISAGVGHRLCIRAIEVWPAWEQPLSTIQKTRLADAYG